MQATLSSPAASASADGHRASGQQDSSSSEMGEAEGVAGEGGPSGESWHTSAAGVHSPMHPSRVRNILIGS